MKNLVLIGALLCVIVPVGVSPAQATPVLILTDAITNDTISIVDNGPNDLGQKLGVIIYTGGLPNNGSGPSGWILNITAGVTKPEYGSAQDPKMDLMTGSLSTSGGGTLNISFSENDFDPSSPSNLSLNIHASTTGSMEAVAYFDPNNQLFQGTMLAAIGPFGPGAFVGSTSGDLSGITGPYSLTEDVHIVHLGPGITVFDENLRVVPEPASLIVFTLGLLGIGWFRVFRRL